MMGRIVATVSTGTKGGWRIALATMMRTIAHRQPGHEPRRIAGGHAAPREVHPGAVDDEERDVDAPAGSAERHEREGLDGREHRDEHEQDVDEPRELDAGRASGAAAGSVALEAWIVPRWPGTVFIGDAARLRWPRGTSGRVQSLAKPLRRPWESLPVDGPSPAPQRAEPSGRARRASVALGEGLAELHDMALEVADDGPLEHLLDRLLAEGRVAAAPGDVGRRQLRSRRP